MCFVILNLASKIHIKTHKTSLKVFFLHILAYENQLIKKKRNKNPNIKYLHKKIPHAKAQGISFI
jgi:hypothetical protein